MNLVKATDLKVVEFAVQLITKHEGFLAEPYFCPANKLTIGYGRTEGVKWGDKTTEPAERVWLTNRVREIGIRFDRESNSLLLPAQCWAALISWAYNVGLTAALKSTAWRNLLAGQLNLVDDELMRWVWHHDTKTGERVRSSGLIRRRQDEASLWNLGLNELKHFDTGELEEPLGELTIEPEPIDISKTNTVRGGGIATITTAITGSIASVAPQLWGLDWRVMIAIVLVVTIVALVGLWVWRRNLD